MTETNAANGANMRQLIDADLQDTLDEEIEMELDDHRLQTLEGVAPALDAKEGLDAFAEKRKPTWKGR